MISSIGRPFSQNLFMIFDKPQPFSPARRLIP
jgi:hypothetical protein